MGAVWLVTNGTGGAIDSAWDNGRDAEARADALNEGASMTLAWGAIRVTVERRSTEFDRIWADVAVLLKDPHDRELPEAEQMKRDHKVRLTIFSGPDFRTPHINSGAVLAGRMLALELAQRVRDHLSALGIPVRDRGTLDEPLGLLPKRGEGEDYARL